MKWIKVVGVMKLTKKSTYEEIKDDHDEMLDELSGESVWFPNPRDTDAEDEDSI